MHEKQLEAKHQIEEIALYRKYPTVAQYCEKWLLMQTEKVPAAILKGNETTFSRSALLEYLRFLCLFPLIWSKLSQELRNKSFDHHAKENADPQCNKTADDGHW